MHRIKDEALHAAELLTPTFVKYMFLKIQIAVLLFSKECCIREFRVLLYTEEICELDKM